MPAAGASGCTGHSGAQLERLRQLDAEVAGLERPPADGPRRTLALPELIDRALQRSPEIVRSELTALTDQADFEQFASAGLPRVGLNSSYGRSAYLRRDESGGLRVAPSLSWDVLRILQHSRMKRFKARSERAGTLVRQIAREEVELEVVRRYVEWEAARTAADLARERAAVAARQARIAELEAAARDRRPQRRSRCRRRDPAERRIGRPNSAPPKPGFAVSAGLARTSSPRPAMSGRRHSSRRRSATI